MSVHDELKKAVNRIAQLEQEVRFHESVVTIQMDEKRQAEGQRDGYDMQLHMTVARLGGKVEGRPTERLNFLQRVDELRAIEHCARWLFSEGGHFAKTPQGHEMRRLLFGEGKRGKLPKAEWNARKELREANDFIEILRAQREGLFATMRDIERRISHIPGLEYESAMIREVLPNDAPPREGDGA